MYQQEVKGKRMSPLAGIGMIALMVLSITAAGMAEQIISQMVGRNFGFIVWGVAAIEVFFLLRLSVREHRYTLTEDRLFIESRYGDSARIIHDIALGAICAIGTEQEIFEKYGNGQSYEKVYTRGCPEPLRAIAYRKEDEIRLLLFQPDEQLCTLIQNHIIQEKNT